jgi:ABC-2 type transport system permease protein
MKRLFAPTGFVWLFAHEARLLWRGSILVRTRRHVIVPLVLVGVVFQAVALAVAWAALKADFSPAILVMIANLNLVFLTFLMLSRAMTGAIDVMYSRGDVDFLLASPIPPSRVLAVRMLGIAAATASPWLLLGGVLANALLLFGHPNALAVYAMIFGVSLAATALAFTLVVLLVGRLGPARARTVAHSFALLIGVTIFALGQAPRFVPAKRMGHLWRAFMPSAHDLNSALWLPGRAMLGAPCAMAATLGVFALIFLTVLLTLDKKFASGAISAAAFGTRAAGRRGRAKFWSEPFTALVLKNLRLLRSFPGLITQTVYRSLTLVPVAMILSGHVKIGSGPEIVVPLLVFLAGQLALFFGSVLVGSDQAPELLMSAPVYAGVGRRASGTAALYATLLIMTLPVLGVLLRDGPLVPAALVGISGAMMSNLAFAERFPIPLVRAGFGKRQVGSVMGLVIGVAVSSAWALGAYLMVAPHPWQLLTLGQK